MQICFPVGWGGNVASVNAIYYDGATNYLTDATLATSNSSTGVLSLWYNFITGPTQTAIISNLDTSARGLYLRRNNASSPGQIFLSLVANGSTSLTVGTTTAPSANSGWHHLLASWNVNATAGSRYAKMYIDDIDVTQVTGDIGNAFSVPYVSSEWMVGAETDASGGHGQKYNGCLSEVYLALGQFLDISITANRRKFITAQGTPPSSLGSNGQDPTGSFPTIYFHGNTATIGNNLGTGGNFTPVGSFANCSTSP